MRDDDVRIPFIFVRHGDPPPLEWMRRHPDWIKIPALFVGHGVGAAERQQAIEDFYAGRRFWKAEEQHPWDVSPTPISDRSEHNAAPIDPKDAGVVVYDPSGQPIRAGDVGAGA